MSSRPLRLALAAGVLAASAFAPAALHAQATPVPAPAAAPAAAPAPDSIAFPRQFVQWMFAGQADSAYAHAGGRLRESMQSVEAVKAMSERVKARFGELQGTDAEVQFDEGALKVYIVALRLSQAPEPAAWIVGYDPATRVVERAAFTSLANIKSRYPQAKLP